MGYELRQRGFNILNEVPIPLVYKDVKIDCGYRLDMLVSDAVIVEIKSVENLAPIHEAQLLSYLKLAGCKIGLLINFNVKMLKQGLKRLAN